jgi:hypothetical protein
MSATTSTRVISDSGYTVPAFNAGEEPVHLEGTAAKLSTAWAATESTGTRQAIETTARELRDCGLISWEAWRAFQYRIGARTQVDAFDFEDEGWLAGEILAFIVSGKQGCGLELLARMQEGIGFNETSRLWGTANAVALDMWVTSRGD